MASEEKPVYTIFGESDIVGPKKAVSIGGTSQILAMRHMVQMLVRPFFVKSACERGIGPGQ